MLLLSLFLLLVLLLFELVPVSNSLSIYIIFEEKFDSVSRIDWKGGMRVSKRASIRYIPAETMRVWRPTTRSLSLSHQINVSISRSLPFIHSLTHSFTLLLLLVEGGGWEALEEHWHKLETCCLSQVKSRNATCSIGDHCNLPKGSMVVANGLLEREREFWPTSPVESWDRLNRLTNRSQVPSKLTHTVFAHLASQTFRQPCRIFSFQLNELLLTLLASSSDLSTSLRAI